MCFALISLPQYVITHKFEAFFVFFTFVHENWLFFQSQIGIYDISRYVITTGLIVHFLCSQLISANAKRNVGREKEPKPIFLRYWHSISKLASFIWPSNNVRLKLCLASCIVLLLLGRITALLAPIYGKKVGMFFQHLKTIPSLNRSVYTSGQSIGRRIFHRFLLGTYRIVDDSFGCSKCHQYFSFILLAVH